MNDLEKKRGINELTFETRQLVDMGRTIAEGAIWTYEEMNKIIGLDIVKRRGLLASARRILQAESGIIFEAVIGTGLRRLTNSDKPKLIGHAIGSIHRKILKTRKAAGTIDVAALPTGAKTELFTQMTLAHMMDHLTQTKTQAKARKLVENAGAMLQIGDTLKLFGNGEK